MVVIILYNYVFNYGYNWEILILTVKYNFINVYNM